MSLINTAYAAPAATGAGAAHQPSMAPMLIILAVIIIFYFWLWKNQGKKKKEQQSLLSALTKGDEVITTGGIAGRISSVEDGFLGVLISKDTVINIQKQAVTAVLPKGTVKHLD
jgi:preprotein translocase subunit YajC